MLRRPIGSPTFFQAGHGNVLSFNALFISSQGGVMAKQGASEVRARESKCLISIPCPQNRRTRVLQCDFRTAVLR